MANTLKIDRDHLASRLKMAIAFVPENPLIPMFENMFISIENGLMRIIASGPSTQIKLFCSCDSKTNWAFCVPAALFLGTVMGHQDNQITITEKSSKKIEIKCGKSKAGISLDCQPENFTPMFIDKINSEITMHQSMLLKAIKTVKDFINPKHPNANFTVMNIAEINNKIIFTGLIRELMCRAAVRPISITSWLPVAIPLDTVKKLLSVIDDKGEVTITHSPQKICFFISGNVVDSVEIISSVHSGEFPGTEALFTACPASGITINTLELKFALKRLKLYANKEAPIFSIDNIKNTQELYLTAMDANTDRDGEELISITNAESMIMDKAFNLEFLIDILNSIDSAEIKILFNEGYSSFIIPVVNSEEENVFNFLVSGIKKTQAVAQ